MVAGNLDKFAFVIEKVSDTGICGCTNGTMQIYINGKKYPAKTAVTAIDTALNHLLCGISAPVHKKENGRHKVPFRELEDTGYSIFMVYSDGFIKITAVNDRDKNNTEFTDEVVLTHKEFLNITEKITEFYNDL